MDKINTKEILLYIELPFPPSQGSYYAYNRRVKYVTAVGLRYSKAVAESCYEQGVYGLQIPPPIRCAIIFYPPDKRVRDFDNHLKALQDALTKAKVWTDDGAVDQLSIYRGEVVPKLGKIYLKIEYGYPLIPDLSPRRAWEIADE